MEKQYWLADAKNVNNHGWTMDVELIDGPHDEPKGVKEAEQIITRIGLNTGLGRNYVMVTIESIPEIEVQLNDDAIDQCKKAVDLTK